MGGSASTNIVDVKRKLAENVTQSCTTTNIDNKILIKGSNFKCLPECRPCNVKIGQNIAFDGQCMVKNSTSYLASTAADQTAKAETGLGFAVSTSISRNTNEIERILREQCGDKDNTISNEIRLEDTNFDICGDVLATQNVSAKTACELGVLSNMADNITVEQASTSTGFFGGSSGMLAIVAIAIAVVVVSGIGGYFYLKTQTGGDESDSLFDKFTESVSFDDKNSYFMYIVIVIIIILVLFMYSKNKPQEPMALLSNDDDCCSAEENPNMRFEINQKYDGLGSCRSGQALRRYSTREKMDDCTLPYYNSLDSYYDPLYN
uniref:Uncharacterized protein n=1 Tax=viral metagenome TaxID=1070528 RepID=A0A6C0C725_9ZZZZ